MLIRWINTPKLSICFFLIVFGCSSPEKKQTGDSLEKGAVVLAPQDFKSELLSSSNAVLVDVRKPEELPEGVIAGAINLDFTDSAFTTKISELDKEKTYFVYCKSGKRSADAVKQMEEAGFEHIYTLEGGLKNWVDQGLETVKP